MTIEISKVSKNGSGLNIEWSDGKKSNFNFFHSHYLFYLCF